MASDVKLSDAARDAALTAVIALIDEGIGFSEVAMQFWTGDPPAVVGDPPPGVPLCTAYWNQLTTVANPIVSHSATFKPVETPGPPDTPGIIQSWRLVTGLGTVICQGTAGTPAEAPVDCLLDDNVVTMAGRLDVTEFTLSF